MRGARGDVGRAKDGDGAATEGGDAPRRRGGRRAEAAAGVRGERLAGPAERAGVLYYCQNGKGLGHIRLTVAIAGEVARRRPDVPQVMATPSHQAAAFAPPPTLATLALPDWDPVVWTADPSPETQRRWRGTQRRMREAAVLATAEAFGPKVMLVDNHPTGVHVLGPTLHRLRAAEPRVALMLGLRDILNEPKIVVEQWEEQGIYKLLEEVYDRILVYGSRDVFDPTIEYRFPPALAAKTRFCGYVKDFEARTPPEAIRERFRVGDGPMILATIGAGGTGTDLLRATLAALRQPALAGATGVVVTGPRMPAAEYAELEATAADLPGARLRRFDDDLQSTINAADLVITAGGYNTTCEVVGFGRRAIVVPRTEHPEPWIRAERFAARGWVTLLHPDGLSGERLAEAIGEALAGPPPAAALDFGGLGCVGDELVRALDA